MRRKIIKEMRRDKLLEKTSKLETLGMEPMEKTSENSGKSRSAFRARISVVAGLNVPFHSTGQPR